MARCQRIKADGERCKSPAMPGASWCVNHHPDRAEQRKRNASRAGKAGGRGRPNAGGELAGIKTEIRTLIRDVLSGDADRGRGAVAGQLYNALLRTVEAERRVRETEELGERLAELETRIARAAEDAERDIGHGQGHGERGW